ncbi:MAG: TlpA family protein disulfide reductase [Clostridia bacterium]|nr:TlpA family protein disulfide reductase [Clostridia bacterium]
MKKLITALLAVCLLLPCLPGSAESTPVVLEASGMNIDFRDVMDASANFVEFDESGIICHDPLVALLCLDYISLPKDVMNALDERYANDSEETRDRVGRSLSKGFAYLAFVIVTDAQDPDDAIEIALGEHPQGAEVVEFGASEALHYYAVLPPLVPPAVDYDAFAEYGVDPETVRQDADAILADMEYVRKAFTERLQTAELYPPADPGASLIGQSLSFETTDLDGNAVTSTELFQDNRITMVNLWGTWCGNCVDEMEALAGIHTRIQEKGCGVVGLEFEYAPIDTMTDEIRAFMEEKGVNYPSVIMPQGNAILDQVSGYPTTFFVDSEGTILTHPIVGAMVDQYERTIDRLLSDEDANAATDAGPVKNESGAYRVIVCDRDGDPVEGVLVQFCDDVMCSFQPTDANGIATFNVEEQKVYDVHVLTAPEGYAPDDGTYNTLDTFSDVSIILDKAA